MKKVTQILSALLALTLCLGALPSQALAGSVPEAGISQISGQTESSEPVEPAKLTALSSSADFEMEGTTLVRYNGSDTIVTVPEGVEHIGSRAFSEKKVTSVTLPGSLISIGDSAFSYCQKLREITIPEGCTSIGASAFYGNWALTKAVVPDSVVSIGDAAFSYCYGSLVVYVNTGSYAESYIKSQNKMYFASLQDPDFIIQGNSWGATLVAYTGPGGDVVIPDGVVRIEGPERSFEDFSHKGVFELNQTITSVTFPDSLTEIGENTFECCKNLKTIRFGSGLKTIGTFAFALCSSLTQVDIPASVTNIYNSAFGTCRNLTQVHIANPDANLTTDVFEGCENLKSYFLADVRINLTDEGFPTTDTEKAAKERREAAILRSQGIPGYQKRVEATQRFLDEYIKEEDYIYTIVTDDVQALSDEVCAGLTTDRAKLRAIHEWIAENIYYDEPGAGILGIPTAQKVLDVRRWVCSGYTSLFQAMAWAQKIPCVYVLGPTTEGFHAWNAVMVDGEWLWVDATWDSHSKYNIKWSKGKPRLDYFLCSTEFISIDHEVRPAGATLAAEGGEITYHWAYVRDGINADLPDEQSPEEVRALEETERELKKDEQGTQMEEETQQTQGKQQEEETRQAQAEQAKQDATLSGWARDEVCSAISNGLVPEQIQSRYSNNITRQEFCWLMTRLITRYSGMSMDDYLASVGKVRTPVFSDTDDANILAAYALGIVKGTSATTFDPNGSITRREAAVMLARTAKLLGMDAGESIQFADAGEFPDWAAEGISFISGITDPNSGKQVMQGQGDSRFAPKGTYTREQAIATALRLFGAAGGMTIRNDAELD